MNRFQLVCCSIVLLMLTTGFNPTQSSLSGGWQLHNGTVTTVLLLQDGYCSFTEYDLVNRKFLVTYGGVVTMDATTMKVDFEFHSAHPEMVGTTETFAISDKKVQLTLTGDGKSRTFQRIDDNTGDLAGTWRITARMQGAQMSAMQPGPRKTLKMLTGTRFQWMAINTQTKEFFGSGGGTYTFANGKYKETIEFFSRDSSRVGASLSFDGNVSGKVWTHKGLSSKGDPIHEEWTKQ